MERAQNDRATYKPQRILKKFKTQVRETIRAHEKKIQPMLKKRVENLSKKLQETLNNQTLPTDEIKISATQIKKEMQ
jgi:hypothetical protein